MAKVNHVFMGEQLSLKLISFALRYDLFIRPLVNIWWFVTNFEECVLRLTHDADKLQFIKKCW